VAAVPVERDVVDEVAVVGGDHGGAVHRDGGRRTETATSKDEDTAEDEQKYGIESSC
jgi:hypothetical protein